MGTLIAASFVVFALTLTVTKSKIMAGKREFVTKRYESAKVGNMKPSFAHRVWHAIWTCPMCSGFWFSIPVCWFFPVYGLAFDVLIVYGINWLIHCIENYLVERSLTDNGKNVKKVRGKRTRKNVLGR